VVKISGETPDPILAIETISFFKSELSIEVSDFQSIVIFMEINTAQNLHFVDINVRRILAQD
jgi:hypothetical protein